MYCTRLDSTRLDYFDYFDGKMARWQDGKASRNFSAFTIFSRKAKKKKAIFLIRITLRKCRRVKGGKGRSLLRRGATQCSVRDGTLDAEIQVRTQVPTQKGA